MGRFKMINKFQKYNNKCTNEVEELIKISTVSTFLKIDRRDHCKLYCDRGEHFKRRKDYHYRHLT